MANILGDDKRQQILALGRLGWPLRRIEEATGIRRETAAGYLKAAGIAIRAPGGWGRRKAKPAIKVTTGSEAKAANASEVTTDSSRPERSTGPTTSTSEPYRELVR